MKTRTPLLLWFALGVLLTNVAHDLGRYWGWRNLGPTFADGTPRKDFPLYEGLQLYTFIFGGTNYATITRVEGGKFTVKMDTGADLSLDREYVECCFEPSERLKTQ